MCALIRILVFTSCCFICSLGYSQNRTALEEQRKTIIKQIEMTSDVLNKTKKNKEETLLQYNLLEDQIKNRNHLVKNIESSIELVEEDMSSNTKLVDSLKTDLSHLKERYHQLLQIQLRKQFTDNTFLSLLNSYSLSEAFTKYILFKQYESYFKQQSERLHFLTLTVEQKMELLAQDKQQKEDLLLSKKHESQKLLESKNKKNELIKSLSENEQKLKADLDRKRNERETLNQAIEESILKELSLVEKNKSSSENSTSNTSRSTLNFVQRKGALPMPTDGKITAWFGKHDHPSIKNIQIENNGIDIKAQSGAAVRSVHTGVVLAISFIPGHQNMVIIQHGDYFSVYSKLKSVDIKVGQQIQENQRIGTIYTDQLNNTELHFEIWKGKTKENPSKWIRL